MARNFSSKHSITTLEQQMLIHLDRNPGITPKALSEAMYTSVAAVTRCKWALISRGYIVENQDGSFTGTGLDL